MRKGEFWWWSGAGIPVGLRKFTLGNMQFPAAPFDCVFSLTSCRVPRGQPFGLSRPLRGHLWEDCCPRGSVLPPGACGWHLISSQGEPLNIGSGFSWGLSGETGFCHKPLIVLL